MKKLKFTNKVAIALIALLVAVFFSSCENLKIPEAPFIVKSCRQSKEEKSYVYEVESISHKGRIHEIIMVEQYAIGDTLWVVGKKYCH